jgi:FKBP-type peptidyl-prolyl cis-trans isomerase FkpA
MKIFNLFLVVFLLSSCSGNSQDKKNDSLMNERIMQMNKAHLASESKRIDEFILTKKFNMQRSGTGLRYEIYQHGKGEKPAAHNTVEVKYKIFLLDGTLCYSSDSSGNAKFRLGEGQQVRGLEEGIMMMQTGDKARFVLPSHLAYGLSGDSKKIPPAQPVYFEIELINVKK